MNLTEQLKQQARQLGFDLAGACPAVTPRGIHRLHDWLRRGYDGQMEYLRERVSAYEHPQHVLEGARSLLMLAMRYEGQKAKPATCGSGRVARYASSGQDYHDVIHARLKPLVRSIERQVPGSRARGVVDTAPLLEREFAQLAGLGWIGKNTLTIHPRIGSWFFLAAVLTDVELQYDEPFLADHCGRCRACLDACPTQAFPEPYVLDATRCISYLTIELRGPVPAELRTELDDWVFGCDVCQEVCPWNRDDTQRAPVLASNGIERTEFEPSDPFNPLPLEALFSWDEAEFRRQFRHTPLWRAKRRGLLRSAALVLGNQRALAARSALELGLKDAEPLVRAACVWALRQLGDFASRQSLETHRQHESDPTVLAEY